MPVRLLRAPGVPALSWGMGLSIGCAMGAQHWEHQCRSLLGCVLSQQQGLEHIGGDIRNVGN